MVRTLQALPSKILSFNDGRRAVQAVMSADRRALIERLLLLGAPLNPETPAIRYLVGASRHLRARTVHRCNELHSVHPHSRPVVIV